ncbi:MAG TPA: hypothetical protein VGB42_09275, partial [Candidatus Thermoplasmatota archaeon]
MARGPTATSAFQPELGAMLAADRRAASRILRERGGFLAAVTALLVGMEWVMASDIIGQFGLSVEMVASVAPFLVPLFAAAALAGFGPVAIRTDALPILKTLPCRARPLYAHAALSFLTTTATWSLAFTVPLAAALAVTQSPQAGYLTLCLGLALPATALSVSLGRYISAATSNRTGPVRWAAWAALGAFLVVPLAAPVAGLPYRPSAIDGGPALLFSQSIALAATEGPLAMVATVLVMVAAGAALSFAPLGRSYDRPSRSRPSPFLADDEEELPDLRPAGLFAPSARQRAAFRSLRGAVPQDDKGPNMRALEMPEGPVATLRFLTANPIALKEVLQMAGILGGALLFLVAFVLWYDPAPLELPAVDLVRVAFLLMLLLAAAACAYRAPSHRHNRELRVLRHRADSVKDGFADRPRRVFGIRSWEMLQTLPVDRAAL